MRDSKTDVRNRYSFEDCKTILSVEKFLIIGVRGRMKKISDYRDTRTFERYNLKGAFDR